MLVLTVVGNRPQFIKSAPLSAALRDAGIEEVVLHTGQHYDRELSAVFFEELGLGEPRYRLGLKTSDPGRMQPAIREAVAADAPDWVIVFGDTNSTLAGAEAAEETPLAHIEAGLRSFDLTMQEERNRMEVDRLSTLLFCPDERSARQLELEGVAGQGLVVGDVMADANRLFGPVARARSDILDRLGLEPGGFVLATVHREANVHPERLMRIAEGLGRLTEPVVFPAHPRTMAALRALGVNPIDPMPIDLIDPLGYLDFTALASQARVIATDSGGVQKEAYWYEVPCVTLRENTEWVETIETGWNRLAGTDRTAIEQAVADAAPGSTHPPLYGDGHAADLTADVLCTIGPK
jgi:UDP-GlcNAc3NAcA epimerase